MVNEFLKSRCRISSEKKIATKLDARMIIDDQNNQLYVKFKQEHPEIGISKFFCFVFYNCRPNNMKLPQNESVKQCLCEVCTNVSLMLKDLQSACAIMPKSKPELRE